MTSSMQSIIESITCPITSQIMTDPVSGNDGHTYERSAIIKWLNQKAESPITRALMTVNDLTANVSIRFLIDQYNSGALGDITPLSSSPVRVANTDIRLNTKIAGIHENKILLDISTPENAEQLSQDIILIIDRSGSMQTAVKAKDDFGHDIEDGLSQQDLVNHAANTVVKTLGQDDRLSVLAFDNEVEEVLPLTLMTPINVSSAMSKIRAVKPRNQTNIWLPISMAIKMLDDREDKSRNSAIMLLTDGAPNISPARGEVETLKRLRKQTNFSTPIYTLGFGYSLQRGLLYDLARDGNGNTGHIPDGSMIATVFNNFIGNILCTVALNVQLYIKLLNGAMITEDPLMGDYIFDQEDNTIVVNLGTVQLEQVRSFVFNFENISSMRDDLPFMGYHISYKIGGSVYTSEPVEVKKADISSDSSILSHMARYTAVEEIQKAINFKNCECPAAPCLTTIREFISDNNLHDTMTKNLLETLNDQLSLALSDDSNHKSQHNGQSISYFKKWGEFYSAQCVLSLARQQRSNFKDAAVKDFGGKTFEKIVDHSSDMFDTLPPPVPSLVSHNTTRGLSGGSIPITPVRTATYNSATAPCFTGDCLITMEDGSVKAVKNIQKDDRIMSVSNPLDMNSRSIATVECVLQTNYPDGYANIVNLERGLQITEWHPIFYRYRDAWVFPANIKKATSQLCEAVYSLVLKGNYIAIINSMPCICFGHEFTHGILEHPYFGSSKVIQDLMQMPGWDKGRIITQAGCMEFDKTTNVASKINYIPPIMVSATIA